jgi:hypothetical protein
MDKEINNINSLYASTLTASKSKTEIISVWGDCFCGSNTKLTVKWLVTVFGDWWWNEMFCWLGNKVSHLSTFTTLFHIFTWGGYCWCPHQVVWGQGSVPENKAWGLTDICFVTREEIHILQQDNISSCCPCNFYDILWKTI